jgi:predicted Zn finger-like uncharacterized protein
MPNQTELEQLQYEERKQAVENQRLINEKLRHEADLVRQNQENWINERRQRGDALRQQQPENKFKAIRKTCNHRMGGKGRESFQQGRGGSSDQYAVVKTKLPTGDVMVRCQRCRTVWLPSWPAMWWKDKGTGKYLHTSVTSVRTNEELRKMATFDQAGFDASVAAYNEAYNFNTDLAMVVLPQYRWSRSGKPIDREVTYRFAAGIIDSKDVR